MNPYLIPWMDDDLEVFRDTVVGHLESLFDDGAKATVKKVVG